jgi:predicted esterase
VAAKNSEPVGLWVCESGADEPKCAVSPWGKEPMNLHFQPALTGNAIYGDRHSARFTVVPPANFSRQKKYPMVIGTSFYEWAPIAHGVYAQALAHSGAFVVLVNYRWDQSRPETIFNHTNNVLAVYDQMVANPCIDKNRVYLFGFSAGTMVVHELVKDYPGRWRGIMLMNAGWLPNPKEGMVGQVLMTAGSTENQDARFRHYQDELCRIGIPASWYIHAGEQHVVRSQRAFYDRTMLMLNMVFEK